MRAPLVHWFKKKNFSNLTSDSGNKSADLSMPSSNLSDANREWTYFSHIGGENGV